MKKKAVFLIQKKHNLIPFCEAFQSQSIEVFKYENKIHLVRNILWILSFKKIYFYTPVAEMVLFSIIGIFMRNKFFYFLHEPYMSLKRVGSLRFYVLYNVWLLICSLGFKYICLSQEGIKRTKINYSLIISRIAKNRVPLCLPKIEVNKDKKFDICMWGSLNHEKGLDRAIMFSKKYPQYSLKILCRKTDYVMSQLKHLKISSTGLILDLRDEFITDEEIFNHISSSRIALLPQRDLNQSAMLPLAWAIGTPVITSDKGSFKEFVNKDSRFPGGLMVKNNLVDELFIDEINECVKEIIYNYSFFKESAIKAHENFFDPKKYYKELTNG
tara:strand:+ start:8589 stop:9572 length:984 start_codon:yes stop_codon:yes gene_type:complete